MFPGRSSMFPGQSGRNMGPCPLGPKEIDGLLVPPGKAYMLLSI